MEESIVVLCLRRAFSCRAQNRAETAQRPKFFPTSADLAPSGAAGGFQRRLAARVFPHYIKMLYGMGARPAFQRST
eukprot:716176-Prymnesium_polylepis.1